MTLPSIFFGGLFANSSTMVKGVGWICYLSPIYYGFDAMMRAEYEKVPNIFAGSTEVLP